MAVSAEDKSGSEGSSDEPDSEDDEIQFQSEGEIIEDASCGSLNQSLHSQATELDYSDLEGDNAECREAESVQSPQEKINEIDQEMKTRLLELKELMGKQGLNDSVKVLEESFGLNQAAQKEKGKSSNKRKNPGITQMGDDGNDNQNAVVRGLQSIRSEATIYENAVDKRNSSSSEEDGNLDSSDDLILNANLVSGEPRPTTSDGCTGSSEGERAGHVVNALMTEQRTEMIIKQAEAAKAKIFPPTGREYVLSERDKDFQFVAKIDQDYQAVGSHVDEATQEKIVKGEYVDFAKLLPKDRISAIEDEGKMELIMRNGQTFWSPVSNYEPINGFGKWEQAFRIFSNIYTRRFPHKSGELIQYNHMIHSIASTYTWDNVYSYDREFRIHLSRHPERSWAVILQQAWSMKLKDRLGAYHQHQGDGGNQSHNNNSTRTFNNHNNSGGRNKFGEACKRYNRGHCKFGQSCRYEHKCSYCGKYGHMVLNCCKLIADKEKAASHKKDKEDSKVN